jgi:TOBE domain-containing protein
VVLRPDAVRLDPAGPVAGCVTASVFGGDRTELTVDVAGASLRVRVAGRDAPAPGARVRLAIDPDAVLVYPAV